MGADRTPTRAHPHPSGLSGSPSSRTGPGCSHFSPLAGFLFDRGLRCVHMIDIERVEGAGPNRPCSYLQRKGVVAMIYGEPEASRFLAAVQRLKRQQRKREKQTRLAKQRVRLVLRKMREC